VTSKKTTGKRGRKPMAKTQKQELPAPEQTQVERIVPSQPVSQEVQIVSPMSNEPAPQQSQVEALLTSPSTEQQTQIQGTAPSQPAVQQTS